MDVRAEPSRRLNVEELMLLSCGAREDSWESLGQQGDQTSQYQPWIFIGMTDAEAEAPILWPPDVKNWLFGRDPDARKDWRQEKGTIEDEMNECHHQLNGHEFEQALGVGGGQGSLVCCNPWGCRVRHSWVTELIDPPKRHVQEDLWQIYYNSSKLAKKTT